jgi:hypothetical protein
VLELPCGLAPTAENAMRPLVTLLAVLSVPGFASSARAGFLTSRAEYDSATRLFTYTYSLDNAAGPWPWSRTAGRISTRRQARILYLPRLNSPRATP